MFSDSWQGIDEIVLYGLGLVSERCIEKLTADFKVAFIIDRKKRGTKYQGISVFAYEDVEMLIKSEKKKIVVTTSQKVYIEIKNMLEKEGFEEYEDFCWVEIFAVEWYWKNRNQMNIFQVDTAVTTFCTFNCKNCNMFLPYYKERKHYSFEELKADMDLLLKNTDYIFVYMFLGGEPFLNPYLHQIIEYAGKTYTDRIGRLSITTNASVIPDEHTLHILKKYHVRIVISDYTKVIDYHETFCKFTETIKERKIAYTINRTLEWKDFGFPETKSDWGGWQPFPKISECIWPRVLRYAMESTMESFTIAILSGVRKKPGCSKIRRMIIWNWDNLIRRMQRIKENLVSSAVAILKKDIWNCADTVADLAQIINVMCQQVCRWRII